MRNFLLASILFLTACGDGSVENQVDSGTVDSVAMMTDTTLPHPKSNVLDSVALDTKTVLIRQDSAAIADAMTKNTTAYWEIMDTMTGDLNRDKYLDMLIVLKGQDDENVDSMAPRPLLVLLGNPDGTLTFAERNNNVVLCHDCGGIFGDPYDGLAIKNGYFSVENYGGSSDRWSKIITFKYNEVQKTWLLHRDGGVTYSVFDPDNETEYFDNKEEYGKLKFVDYNYN